MILIMTQTHSPAEGLDVGIEYEFYNGKEKIARFYAKNKPSVLPMSFEGEYKGKNEYNIILEKNDICPEGYKDGMLAYQIKKDDGSKIAISKYDYNYYDSNNELVGKLKYVTVSPKKEKIFELPKAYPYQEFTFKGEKYDMYDVRVGGTGIFYCIYKENELVAMIERNLNVVNWLDNYVIYALDEIDTELLCLAAAYYDYVNFEEITFEANRNGEFSRETGVSTIEYRKDILNKYDPEFKKRIINMTK